MSGLTMDEISGATIDTRPQYGDSVGASTATAKTDTVPLEKVETMIQNDIAENGNGGDSDAGGYGHNIVEDFMEARRDVEIDRVTSDFNEIETNVLSVGATTATDDSIGATTATNKTDTVPLEKVEAMIQNNISENGDGDDYDAGGDGYNIMEDFMAARHNVEIDRLTSDFNDIETNVLDDTKNCTMSVSNDNMALPTYLNSH